MPSPSTPALVYYGDDFTGSTDALEFLTRAGLRTALFIAPPTADQLRRHGGLDAIGVAGLTRSLAPEAMERELRPAFIALRALGAAHAHYKVCSTFDSSPAIGSIGRAIEIGAEVFGSRFVPLVVGAPPLGRHCVFGNLFARMGIGSAGAIHRLDRHPSMSKHPSTPANESDLRLHLARQTAKPIGLVDILAVAAEDEAVTRHALERELESGAEIVLFDVLHERELARIGALIDADAATGDRPLFSAGSSAIEMALGAHWQAQGRFNPPASFSEPVPDGPLLVVSGSCSPTTDRQIGRALAKGFVEMPLDAAKLASSSTDRQATDRVIDHLRAGRHVIVHTSRGLVDATLATIQDRTAELFGRALGLLAREAIAQVGIKRLVVAGGDTSSHAARALGIEAVEMIAPLSPGAPWCRAFAPGSPADGIAVNFKGGQVGAEDYFLGAAEAR